MSGNSSMPRDLRAYHADVDDALVWGVIERDLAGLRAEAAMLLSNLDGPTDS